MNQPTTAPSTATTVPGPEGVDHEVEGQHLPDVVDRVRPGPASGTVRAGRSSVAVPVAVAAA